MNAAGIIFSNLNERTLSRMTQDRTVAAIPVACRYRLVDFPLSSMVHADINHISIISNYNYRSLTEHIGSGKDWDLARRDGGIRLISPYQTAHSPHAAMYSHHMEALINMQVYIREIREDYVVLSDSDQIYNLDLKDILSTHALSNADVTLVDTPCDPNFTRKGNGLFIKSKDHIVEDVVSSSKAVPGYNHFMNIYVFKTAFLNNMLNEAIASGYKSLSKDFLIDHHSECKCCTYTYTGYSALISSFTDYYRVGIELATNPKARKDIFLNPERPILTKVHNSTPVIYGEQAHVSDSMIADGCSIHGTVENSILFRGVSIGEGAVVRNCILFGGTTVEPGASLNCIVTDKNVLISQNTVLSGAKTLPFFIGKSQHI